VEFQISYQCNAKGRKHFEDSGFIFSLFLFLVSWVVAPSFIIVLTGVGGDVTQLIT
jgi:hypothetical protein